MATTSTGPNMAKTAPSKTVTREKAKSEPMKKAMRSGQVSQAAYDKISGKGKKC